MPKARKKTSKPRNTGRLRIGDDWNAITIIALSQCNPLKAVAEFVENSIDAGARQINSFIVAGTAPLATPQRVTLADVPERHSATLWDMLARPRVIDSTLTASGKIIYDAWNAAALDMAATQAEFRRGVLESAPPALLLN